MTRAYVLMTAMPPTVGHLHLVQFANALADETVVIVCTQPDEPYHHERYMSMVEATKNMSHVRVAHLHRTLEQDPSAEGFWPMWDRIMQSYGFQPGDIAVSSEPYGATLAQRLGGIFMPYDPARQLYYVKATNIRNNMVDYFHDILPEFQPFVRQTVTFFGAESTGKTTLSEKMSRVMNGHWLFEYARPYLETVGSDLDLIKMYNIWKGQAALQAHARDWTGKPWIVQDTDLFSTVGYWQMWESRFGCTSPQLITEARNMASDLYIMTPSNIAFEADPLRYGGDVREGSDEYWEKVLADNGLNYVVLESNHPVDRVYEAEAVMKNHMSKVAATLFYERQANG